MMKHKENPIDKLSEIYDIAKGNEKARKIVFCVLGMKLLNDDTINYMLEKSKECLESESDK